MNVFEKISEVIADQTGGDISSITEGTTFEELGLDSLDIVEIVMKIEEELCVELEMDDKYENVGELAKFIESKLSI